MHKYNNQDHILTACIENINAVAKNYAQDLWKCKPDAEYQGAWAKG